MKQLLFILSCALLLIGCDDTFTGPSRPIGMSPSEQIVYSAIDYSNPSVAWRFGGIRVMEVSTGLSRVLVENNVYLICAPQAGRIVYIEFDGKGSGMRLKTARTDGSDERVIQEFDGLVESVSDRAALSADGKNIAYIVNFNNGQWAGYRLMVYDVHTGLSTQIDTDEHWTGGSGKSSMFITHVSFSPQGTYLGAVKWNGQGHIQIYRMADGGRDMAFYTTGPHFSWLSTGNQIVYTENPGLYISDYGLSGLVLTSTDYTTIKRSNIDNGNIVVLAEYLPVIWDVTVSHDGQQLAISQFREGSMSTTDIVRFNLANPGQPDTLTAVSGDGYRSGLYWSGDDAYVLYTVSSNPYPLMLYGEIRRIAMKGQGKTEQLIQQLAYGGYWYTN